MEISAKNRVYNWGWDPEHLSDGQYSGNFFFIQNFNRYKKITYEKNFFNKIRKLNNNCLK